MYTQRCGIRMTDPPDATNKITAIMMQTHKPCFSISGTFLAFLGISESLAPGPADALSADPAISAPWAPVYSCLTGGGASSVVGDAGCSRGASAPGPPAGSCAGMMPDSCLRALKRLVYPRRRRRRERVDGGVCCNHCVHSYLILDRANLQRFHRPSCPGAEPSSAFSDSRKASSLRKRASLLQVILPFAL